MSRYLIDRIDASEQISVRPQSRVVGAEGNGHLERLLIEDVDTGEREAVAAGALFVFIGQRPRTEWLDGLVLTDEKGFIVSGVDMSQPPSGWPLERRPLPLETSLPGVFVAGDVRSGSVKRVASAVGEGGIAVRFIHQHLSSL
jgi:thioredoxin reductase (NADPH)